MNHPHPQGRRTWRKSTVLGRMLGIFWLPAAAIHGQTLQEFVFDRPVPIPDGSAGGVAASLLVDGIGGGWPFSITLSLSGTGDGMLNGDIYAALSHEDESGRVEAYAVLLNRPGRRPDDLEGYKDNGLSVTFTADPQAPDIHNYRLALLGRHDRPLAGVLGGIWSPDGRSTDPDDVLDDSARTASLEEFSALDSYDGRWTLFVADVVPGGTARLDGWSVKFVVPEPSVGGLMIAGTIWCFLLRKPRSC
jgi:hypothetical protein